MITHETCRECRGSGTVAIDICISEWEPSQSHVRYDELAEIVADAVKAKSDHQRLCAMNPRAKESYDSQLAETLLKLEARAKAIL